MPWAYILLSALLTCVLSVSGGGGKEAPFLFNVPSSEVPWSLCPCSSVPVHHVLCTPCPLLILSNGLLITNLTYPRLIMTPAHHVPSSSCPQLIVLCSSFPYSLFQFSANCVPCSSCPLTIVFPANPDPGSLVPTYPRLLCPRSLYPQRWNSWTSIWQKDSSLLLYAIHSTSHWRILKTTILFSDYKNTYNETLETRKLNSIHECHFVERINEGIENLSLRNPNLCQETSTKNSVQEFHPLFTEPHHDDHLVC